MLDFSYTIWIPLIPFIMFLITGLLGGKMKPEVSGYLGTLGLLTACGLSLFTAYNYFFVAGQVDGAYQTIVAWNFEWLHFTDELSINVGSLIDPISVMMLVVITFISLMVHIYSLGYMKGEEGFARFYAFLSLFTFSMLGLVLATNIFQMYIFWELVGVSSYLLIGYYYNKPSAVAASKKAFIVTRFADLGFLIGILFTGYYAHSYDFSFLTGPEGLEYVQQSTAVFMGLSLMTWAIVMVYVGGAGKSAMFPLHVWLPDAMEGPTPVSALIHAATMVVAGVYMVARLFPIFLTADSAALEIVAIVGAFSSLFAAVIACTQTDIKRVLAYSTMSQIGYMMCALGVAGSTIDMDGQAVHLGYTASMFHLFTHAMFKALLFLGAGSIIHAVHSNELKDMGGLRKYMPITHITFLIACLAIAGIPPFAGFFSKDEILVAAFEHNKIYFAIEYFVAGLTAFYMFRLYFGIFWGKDQTYEHAPHESPLSMSIPLMILAAASCTVGFIPFNELVTADGIAFHSHIHWNIALPSIGVALAGIMLAFVMYKKESGLPDKISTIFSGLYKAAYQKFYIDEIYLFITKKIIFNLISTPLAWFDRHVIDATMNGVANTTTFISDKIKTLQSGQLQQYAIIFVSGAVLLGFIFIYMLSR